MRPITDVIRDLRRGKLVDLATTMLDEVVAAVEETGKSGKVVLEISIAKAQGDEEGVYEVSGKVKHTVPVADIGGSTLFGRDLTKNDPRQQEMTLRNVDREPVAVAQ